MRLALDARSNEALASPWLHSAAMAPGVYEVVVPTYNVERTIAATLSSLSEQTLPPSRILVADDETPDGSLEVAARFPNVEIMSFPHSGLSGVQNRALPHVRSEFLAFVDADDIWHPDAGRVLVAALQSTNAVAAAIAADEFPDGSLPTFPDPLPPVWAEVGYEALLARNTLCKSGTMYRTEAVRGVGGWLEDDYPITGDHDIALRLMEAGGTILATSWRGAGFRTTTTSLHRNPGPTMAEQIHAILPRAAADSVSLEPARVGRQLWFRTLAKAAQDRRDLRDVPALSTLTDELPAGQRALEALVRSPLRHGLAAGWRLRSPR